LGLEPVSFRECLELADYGGWRLVV